MGTLANSEDPDEVQHNCNSFDIVFRDLFTQICEGKYTQNKQGECGEVIPGTRLALC